MKLALDVIRLDGGTQSRVALSADTVAEYVEAIRRGDEFPPAVVFHDGKIYWLADGFHRAEGYKQAGQKEIECDVREGGQRDAILFSVSANETHGLRRNAKDRRRAVEMLLSDPEWSGWSDRQIGRLAGMSHTQVANIREKLSGNSCQIDPEAEAAPRKAKRKGKEYEMKPRGSKKTAAASTRRTSGPDAPVPRPREKRSPANEAERVKAVMTATSEVATQWEALVLDWEGNKRFDMLFAKKPAAAIRAALQAACDDMFRIFKQCEAGSSPAEVSA